MSEDEKRTFVGIVTTRLGDFVFELEQPIFQLSEQIRIISEHTEIADLVSQPCLAAEVRLGESERRTLAVFAVHCRFPFPYPLNLTSSLTVSSGAFRFFLAPFSLPTLKPNHGTTGVKPFLAPLVSRFSYPAQNLITIVMWFNVGLKNKW